MYIVIIIKALKGNLHRHDTTLNGDKRAVNTKEVSAGSEKAGVH